MTTIYLPSEEDRAALQEMVAEWRGRTRGTTRRTPFRHEEESQASEVYVARVPEGGIAGLDENTTGTETVTSYFDDDTLSYAECLIYKRYVSGGVSYLRPTGVTKRVYNLSRGAIVGRQWVLVTKDKFGDWYLTSPIDSSSSSSSSGSGGSGGGSTFDGVIVGGGGATLTSGTFDTISFTSAVSNPGGYWSAGIPNQISLPAGKWLVGASLIWNLSTATTGTLGVTTWDSISSTHVGQSNYTAGGNGGFYTTSYLYSFAAAATVKVFASNYTTISRTYTSAVLWATKVGV